MGIFEGLTVPAKQVLARATDLAALMGSADVEGAHLVLAFLDAEGTAAQKELSRHIADRSVAASEAQRLTLSSRNGAHPAFGEEVVLTLAAARGIAVGRQSDEVGTGTCLLALLTLMPSSAEQLLATCGVDVMALRTAAKGLNDADEPTGPSPQREGQWTVTTGAAGPVGWDDQLR